MSVCVDVSGRRSVTVAIEVTGSVEEAWRAIATEQGMTAWFVPATIECDDSGRPTRLVCHFGAGMDAASTITKWDEPRGFTAESRAFVADGTPVTTVWSVEEGADETCLVQVEYSLFADSDQYDSKLEGVEAGWPAFFRILQIYMSGYRGQPCSLVELLGTAPDDDQAWRSLAGALGLADAVVGEYRSAPADAPKLAGVVDSLPDSSEIILQLDEPAAGVAHLFAWPVEDRVLLSIRLFFYGEDAAEGSARAEPLWRNWLMKRFPPLVD